MLADFIHTEGKFFPLFYLVNNAGNSKLRMSKFNSGEGSKGSVTRSAKNWLKQPKYPLPFPPEYEAKCGYSKEETLDFFTSILTKT